MRPATWRTAPRRPRRPPPWAATSAACSRRASAASGSSAPESRRASAASCADLSSAAPRAAPPLSKSVAVRVEGHRLARCGVLGVLQARRELRPPRGR